MAHYTGELTTEMRPDDVWRYLADLRSIAQWDPSVEDARLVAGDPGIVGTRYVLDVRFLGRTVALPYETVVAEPPHRLVFAAETDAMSIADEAVILPLLSGSSVTWSASLRLRGAKRLLDPPLQVAFARLGKNAEDGLRERLAGPVSPAPLAGVPG
jgi:uncharacterized protein YndB with AHSA1/START domain